MTKFQKAERIIAFIPGESILFIAIATYFLMSKRKASAREWCKYALILGTTVLAVFFGNRFLLSGEVMIANLLLTVAIGLYPNMEMIKMQTAPSNPNKEATASVEAKREDAVPCAEASKDGKSSSKKTAITVGIVFVAVIMTVGIVCSAIPLFRAIFANTGNHIKDTNGDADLTLCQLTDADILSTQSDYALLGVSQSVTGDSTNIDINDPLSEVDGDCVSLQFWKFSGVDTVHATKSEADSLKLSISGEVTKGNCRIVVLVDGSYYCDVNPNTTEEIVLSGVSGKLVTVRLAGESLKIQMTVTREVGA